MKSSGDDLAAAEAKVDKLRAELRQAIRHRNEIRASLRVMCVAMTKAGDRCCFPAIDGYLCWHHVRFNQWQANLATRLEEEGA